MEEVDEKIIFKITQSKMRYLDLLKTNMVKLEKDSAEVLKKIENHGLAAKYSCNSDIMRHAECAWRASLALCELDDLMINLENKTYKQLDSSGEE